MIWFSRARHIKRMGPFNSQLEAWESVMTADGVPAPESTVWCEAEPARPAPEPRRAGDDSVWDDLCLPKRSRGPV